MTFIPPRLRKPGVDRAGRAAVRGRVAGGRRSAVVGLDQRRDPHGHLRGPAVLAGRQGHRRGCASRVPVGRAAATGQYAITSPGLQPGRGRIVYRPGGGDRGQGRRWWPFMVTTSPSRATVTSSAWAATVGAEALQTKQTRDVRRAPPSAPDLESRSASLRAARQPWGRIPVPTPAGNQLRHAARLISAYAYVTGDRALTSVVLLVRLAALAEAVAELRESQQRAAQAAAALRAARHLRSAATPPPPDRPAGPPHPPRHLQRNHHSLTRPPPSDWPSSATLGRYPPRPRPGTSSATPPG